MTVDFLLFSVQVKGVIHFVSQPDFGFFLELRFDLCNNLLDRIFLFIGCISARARLFKFVQK